MELEISSVEGIVSRDGFKILPPRHVLVLRIIEIWGSGGPPLENLLSCKPQKHYFDNSFDNNKWFNEIYGTQVNIFNGFNV